MLADCVSAVSETAFKLFIAVSWNKRATNACNDGVTAFCIQLMEPLVTPSEHVQIRKNNPSWKYRLSYL